MRRPIAFVLLASGLAGCANAAPATRAFGVTGFDRITVAGPFDVSIHTGSGVSVRATGDAGVLDRLSMSVDSGLLRIRPTADAANGWLGGAMGRVKIAVTVPALRAASLFGSGALAIDRVRADEFRASLDGSGSLSVAALQADRVTVMLGGSGDVTLAGKAQTVRATLAGSGQFDGAALASADATIVVQGSGDAKLAASHSANVSATGSGDVTVTGAATCKVAQHGSGDVHCGRGG